MHEQDGDGEPAHHARRPMNAFLIFCKRHRSVVRDKYPNLENRSITKILGEWWANLDKEEKAGYTGLAKQYKDAFFSANPDFKWYKLPAPPLRTLSSRPRESTEKTIESSVIEFHENETEKTNNNSTKMDFNARSGNDTTDTDPKPLSMFTPGKLADEAQMGGLSSLLASKTDIQTPNSFYTPPSYKMNSHSTPVEYRSHLLDQPKAKREDTILELQNALSETSKIFEEDLDEEERMYHYNVPNDQFTNQDVIDQIVDKRYSKDEEGYEKSLSDDERNSKSGRSCKGKRYQEFMAIGGLLVNKRQRREDRSPDDDYNASCSWETVDSREDLSVPANYKQDLLIETSTLEYDSKMEPTDTTEQDNNANKTFKAADFDLDAKIRALPSLSLEKFQQKKRENKRKKKMVNLKPKSASSSQIINSVPRSIVDGRREMAENWRDTVIGSQKRKPRKISITRLEINSLVTSMEVNGGNKISPEIKIATEAPCTAVQNMDACNQRPHSNVDLLALATLAEVAANTSKIENITNISAKASDGNASKV